MKYNKITKGIALLLCFVSTVVQAEDLLDETIESIVVSGQKIERTIKETVNSVSVLTAKDMIKQNVKNCLKIKTKFCLYSTRKQKGNYKQNYGKNVAINGKGRKGLQTMIYAKINVIYVAYVTIAIYIIKLYNLFNILK